MANIFHSKMNSIQLSSSILVLLITLSEAIRVDWNTNKGPIVPRIPAYQPPPKLPYREPAPVWEDQSDDIPNPNQYRYVLPPPSRPRPLVDNYLRAPLYLLSNIKQQKPNLGLSVEYIPNVGKKYSVVVPYKSHYLKQNDIYDHKDEKENSRYEAKLKKYNEYLETLAKYHQSQHLPQTNRYQFSDQMSLNSPIINDSELKQMINEIRYRREQSKLNPNIQQLNQQQPPQSVRSVTNFNKSQLPILENSVSSNNQLMNHLEQQQIKIGLEQNQNFDQLNSQQRPPQQQINYPHYDFKPQFGQNQNIPQWNQHPPQQQPWQQSTQYQNYLTQQALPEREIIQPFQKANISTVANI